MALSLMVSFPLEPQLERFGPVQGLDKSPVYGRAELNCMTVLMVQLRRQGKAVLHLELRFSFLYSTRNLC